MTRWRLYLICFTVPLLVAGCGSSGNIHYEEGKPERPEGSVVDLYRIVPGDVLSIDGGKNLELSKDQVRVDEKGEINLLHIGKIKASELTKSELEEAINAAYQESRNYDNPQVSISVLTLFYYVDGQVNVPGKKQYLREITVYRAIIDAGSFTEFAAPSRVRLQRPGPDGLTKVYRIDVRAIMQGAEPDDVVVLPNDVIRVPKSIF